MESTVPVFLQPIEIRSFDQLAEVAVFLGGKVPQFQVVKCLVRISRKGGDSSACEVAK